MDLNYWKNAAKKAGRVGLAIAGVSGGFWVFLALIDFLILVYNFFSSANILQDYGLSEFAAKIVAGIFAAIASLVGHGLLRLMIKRDHKRWVPRLAVIVLLWYVIMYVAAPHGYSPYNIFTGPGKMYRDQYGTIHPVPRGAKTGPAGEAVIRFTPSTAQEYERQEGGVTPQSNLGLWDRLFGSDEKEGAIRMAVERIDLLPEITNVHVVVWRANNRKAARFYPPQEKVYLVNLTTRETYDMVAETATYPDLVDAESHQPWKNDSTGKYASTKMIRQDEAYRFVMHFLKINWEVSRLRLHDPRFGSIELDSLLPKAKDEAQRRAEAAAAEARRLEAEKQANKEAEDRRVAEEIAKHRIAAEEAARAAKAADDLKRAEELANEGISFSNRGNPQAAIEPLEESLRIAPNMPEANRIREILARIKRSNQTSGSSPPPPTVRTGTTIQTGTPMQIGVYRPTPPVRAVPPQPSTSTSEAARQPPVSTLAISVSRVRLLSDGQIVIGFDIVDNGEAKTGRTGFAIRAFDGPHFLGQTIRPGPQATAEILDATGNLYTSTSSFGFSFAQWESDWTYFLGGEKQLYFKPQSGTRSPSFPMSNSFSSIKFLLLIFSTLKVQNV